MNDVVLYTLISIILLGTGGNLVCRLLFKLTKLTIPTQSAATSPRAGRVIGWFERVLIAAGIISGSWEAVVAVVALKTVARFKELDDQVPAEYFLVGSLFSLAWAIAITGGWLAYDQKLGANLSSEIRTVLVSTKKAADTRAGEIPRSDIQSISTKAPTAIVPPADKPESVTATEKGKP